jgi:hypothetical protein
MTVVRNLRSVLATRVERGIVVFTLIFAFASGMVGGLQALEVQRIAANQHAPSQTMVVASRR